MDRATSGHVPHDQIRRMDRATAPPPPPATASKPKKKRIRIKTERRREQCHVNQARYRNKRRILAAEQRAAVEQLASDVEHLETQRHTLMGSTSEAASTVVRAFHELFRYGLNVRGQSFGDGSQLPSLERQLAFVASAFREDLVVDELCGCAHFLEQTRRFATLFEAPTVELQRLHATRDPVACYAHSLLAVTVSAATIRCLFPHLLRVEHGEIRCRLLGRRLACPVSSLLVFDDHGRVARLDWAIDFVSALQQATLTLEVAALVLRGARIRRGFLLESAGDENEDFEQAPDRFYRREIHQTDAEGGLLLHDGLGDDFVMV